MNIKEPFRILLANAAAIILTAVIIPSVDIKMDFYTIGLATLVFSLVHLILKPLIKIIAIPINFITLGLFDCIINAGLLYLVTYFVDGLTISGGNLYVNALGITIPNIYLEWYWMLLLAAIVIGVIKWLIRKLVL